MHYYLSGKQARDIDRYTSETIGIPGIVLMERASLELANVISELFESGTDVDCENRISLTDNQKNCTFPGAASEKKILAVVGTGNNGGDAVAAARILKTRGHNAHVYEVNPHGKKTDSFLIQEKIAKNLVVEFMETLPENASAEDLASAFSGFDVIIDGIFGVGLTREVEGVYASAIKAINIVGDARKKPVIVGCDIPSGTDSDTGLIKGCAVKCDITVTFGYNKLGLLINDGRTFGGKIICKEIGLYKPATTEEAKGLFEGVVAFEYDRKDIPEKLPVRVPDSNKGTNGKVLIVAGSKDVFGAMYLCTSACCAVGAGLVKVVTHDRNRDLLMDKLPEAMVLTYDDSILERTVEPGREGNINLPRKFDIGDELNAPRKSDTGLDGLESFTAKLSESVAWADVVLIGPGLGTDDASRMLFKSTLSAMKSGQRLVLDADALNVFSGMIEDDINNLIYDTEDGSVVFTPHIGEMVRIMKGLGRDTSAEEIKKNPAEAAQWVSSRTGAVCVLKDARTVVADPADDRIIYINTTGNSGMSKGGSGDVLAGITAGLLARTKKSSQSVFETACAAVNIHGRAGDRARESVGESCMLAGNLIDELRR